MEHDYLWDIFISYASEDKDAVALPLSEYLQEYGISVWIESEILQYGDNWRRKINEGLAKSRFGVVILSKSFFQKDWTRMELDALLSRERNGVKVVIPIWHKVSRYDVTDFSHILADRFAADTSTGLKKIASNIKCVVEYERKITIDNEKDELLSRGKLLNLTENSRDPEPQGPVLREGMNAHLSDEELRDLIKSRNAELKPTYLLRLEYELRLNERGL